MLKVRCSFCREEVELNEYDIEIEGEVEEVTDDTMVITIYVTAECPKCRRLALDLEETVEIKYK